MYAIRIHQFGDQPLQESVEPRHPAAGEVMAQMMVATVNPLDVWVSRGEMAGTPLPITLGAEGVAMVDNVPTLVRGSGIGVTRDGTYAEHLVAPREALIPLPRDVDVNHAASVGIADLQAFNKACRRELGGSPRAVRAGYVVAGSASSV